jgi:hypothetical protein
LLTETEREVEGGACCGILASVLVFLESPDVGGGGLVEGNAKVTDEAGLARVDRVFERFSSSSSIKYLDKSDFCFSADKGLSESGLAGNDESASAFPATSLPESALLT